ncbi:MAG: hypothetical protein AAGD32_03165 [Planctomycetota bacterium]
MQHAARQPDFTALKDVRADVPVGSPVETPSSNRDKSGISEQPEHPPTEPRDNDTPTDPGAAERTPGSDFTDWLPRHMIVATLVLLPIWLAAFNGQWRIGSDTALYRVVARSIVETGTYRHGMLPETHVFPGLPMSLAGVQSIFGEADLPPVLLINLMAIGVLVLTYKLIRTNFEPWVAACVTFGMALNGELLLHTQEILTDVPFLLGVVAAWWGWERFQRPGQRVTGGVLLVLGLAFAASMRPTFWVLAGAWLIVSTWKAIAGPNRLIHASVVALVAIVGVSLIILDPRFTGFNVLNGGYEMRAVEAVGELDGGILGNVMHVFGRQLPHGFFGEPMSPFGLIWAAPLLVGLVMVTRRVPLWGVTAWLLIGTTVVLSAAPRYYLMILPVLWLGWVLFAQQVWHWTDRWLRSPGGRKWERKLPPNFAGFAMCLVILLVPLTNAASIVNLIWEQRQPDFLNNYAEGKYLPMIEAAGVVAAHTDPDDIVIAPGPRVLSYFARRTVIGDPQFYGTGGDKQALAIFSDIEPDWCVFPASAYRETDRRLTRLLDNSQRDAPIVATEPVQWLDLTVGETEWYLARPVRREE